MAQLNQIGRCRKCGRAIHSTDSFSYQVTGNDAYYVCESCLEGKVMYDFTGQLAHIGHWINEPGKIPKCSECGRYSDDADTGDAKYCPFCGAVMNKEGE